MFTSRLEKSNGQVSALCNNILDEYSSKEVQVKNDSQLWVQNSVKKKKNKKREKRDLAKGPVEIPWKTVKGVKGSPKAQLNQEN